MNQPDPPQFAEPWEAQALALANELVQAGRFTAAEWASALGGEIKRAEQAGRPDDGTHYYRHVLNALETLTTGKSMLTREMLDARKEAWAEAYEHTPHGRPVTLEKPADSG